MATPDNGKNIFNSLNPTYNYLLLQQVLNKIIVVDQGGNGNYTSIKEAVEADSNANKLIYVKAGTYTETGAIILKNQSLIGESPFTTKIIIDTTMEMQTPTASDIYTTGTLTLTNASSNVLGAGTTWSPAGPSDFTTPWLITNGMALPISNIVDATNLTLENRYEGVTNAGLSYSIIDAFNIGSKLCNFDITHSASAPENSLNVSGINCIVENNFFHGDRSNSSNIVSLSPALGIASNCQIKNNQFHSGINGISLSNVSSSIIDENKFYNQVTFPIVTTTPCFQIDITNNHIYSSGSHGISIGNTSLYVNIFNNKIIDVSGDGISVGTGCNDLSILNNTINQDPTQSFITMAGVSANMKFNHNITLSDGTIQLSQGEVLGNYFEGAVALTSSYSNISGNTSLDSKFTVTGNYNDITSNVFKDAIADNSLEVIGTNSNISSNNFENIQNLGIKVRAGGYHTICSNNLNLNLTEIGIQVEGSNCIVSNNIIKDAGGTAAIYLTSDSDNTICDSNHISGGDTGTHAIYSENQECQISNNHIDNLDAANGIMLDSAAGSQDIDIKNNYMKDVAIGILCIGNDNINIIGNTIHTPTSHGIHMNAINQDFCIISENNIINAGGSGILIGGSTTDSIINNNIINNPTAYGIWLNTGVSSNNQNISHNKIFSAGNDGIFLDDEGSGSNINNQCVVDGNNITSCTGDGISSETDDNIISNNFILGCANGITLSVGDRNIIKGNNCRGNTTDGINVAATSDRIVITSNICLTNGTNQILNNGTNTSVGNNIIA